MKRRFVIVTSEIQEALEQAILQFPSQNAFCRASGITKDRCADIRNGRLIAIEKVTLKKITKFVPLPKQKLFSRMELEERGLFKRRTDNFGRPAYFKWINGQWQKKCHGLHGRIHPPKFVPVTEFYPAKTLSGLRAECKYCTARGKGKTKPMVKFSMEYKAWVTEIINRIGIAEAHRRIGITQSGLWDLRNRPPVFIKAKTAEGIVRVLAEIRVNN